MEIKDLLDTEQVFLVLTEDLRAPISEHKQW